MSNCLCLAHETCLWTTGKSYVCRNVSGAQILSTWQCERCKTKRAFCVGDLWIKTSLSLGLKPSCALGCVGSTPHKITDCPRRGSRNLQVFAVSSGNEIVIECGDGPDFFTVWQSDPRYMVYATVTFKVAADVLGEHLVIKTGACVPPRIYTRKQLSGTFVTNFIDSASSYPSGELPFLMTGFKIVPTSATLIGPDGCPQEEFVGISAQMWSAIWRSPCAKRRYACILNGHTTNRRLASEQSCANLLKRCKVVHVATGVGASQEAPFYFTENQNIVCAYCKQIFTGNDAYVEYTKVCVPDLATGLP